MGVLLLGVGIFLGVIIGGCSRGGRDAFPGRRVDDEGAFPPKIEASQAPHLMKKDDPHPPNFTRILKDKEFSLKSHNFGKICSKDGEMTTLMRFLAKNIGRFLYASCPMGYIGVSGGLDSE